MPQSTEIIIIDPIIVCLSEVSPDQPNWVNPRGCPFLWQSVDLSWKPPFNVLENLSVAP